MPCRWTLPAGPRGVRSAGLGGLARSQVRQALARTREYTDIVRKALRRERLQYDGEFFTLPLPDGPGKALTLTVHPVRDQIPMYLAAIGPKNLELTRRTVRRLAGDLLRPEFAGSCCPASKPAARRWARPSMVSTSSPPCRWFSAMISRPAPCPSAPTLRSTSGNGQSREEFLQPTGFPHGVRRSRYRHPEQIPVQGSGRRDGCGAARTSSTRPPLIGPRPGPRPSPRLRRRRCHHADRGHLRGQPGRTASNTAHHVRSGGSRRTGVMHDPITYPGTHPGNRARAHRVPAHLFKCAPAHREYLRRLGRPGRSIHCRHTDRHRDGCVLIYFRHDIWRILSTWTRSLYTPELRSNIDTRMGWYVIFGTLPIGFFGFVFSNQIETAARNLWLVATVLIVFGLVLGAADRWGRRRRPSTT